MTDVFNMISQQLADPEAQWSFGTFGAIAEFARDADEPADILRDHNALAVVTPRGGIRLDAREQLKAIAFETLTTQSWSQRVAFCLPEPHARMNVRATLTELGPDVDALRTQDRDARLFDLGLGALQVDCCIRTADEDLVTGLRAHAGRSLFESGNPAMGIILRHNPHRVFVTRAGRAEVYQPIPPPGGVAPEGPHTHVLPKLLAHGRTHAATEPIPSGWISCAHLYPAHSLRNGLGRARPFDLARHTAFQDILVRHGDADHVKLKRAVERAISAGDKPNTIALPAGRFEQACLRIALRQIKTSRGHSPLLAQWLAAHDAAHADEPSEDWAHAT